MTWDIELKIDIQLIMKVSDGLQIMKNGLYLYSIAFAINHFEEMMFFT